MLVFTIDSAQVSDGQEILVRVVEGDGTALEGTYVDADINVVVPVGEKDVTGLLGETNAVGFAGTVERQLELGFDGLHGEVNAEGFVATVEATTIVEVTG